MCLTRAEFEQLYRDHGGEILGYLTRRIGPTDAPDLLADTFLVTWRRRDELPAPELRRAWLFATARNLMRAHLRTTIPLAPTGEAHQAETPPGPSHDTSATDQTVRDVLAALDDTDRELLTMTCWERLSVAEAGRALGLTSGTARVRLHRVRRRLARDPRLVSLLPPVSTGDVARDPLAWAR